MSAKLIATAKKRANMSRDDFIQCYEVTHAPLVLNILPPHTDFRRNYITIEGDRAPAHLERVRPLDFDVVTTFRFESLANLAQFQRTLAETEAGRRVVEGETRLFDRGGFAMFEVEEHVTSSGSLMPHPQGRSGLPAVTMLAFIRARPDLSRSGFIERYETGHVHTALRLLRVQSIPLFASYVRNYVVPGERAPRGGSELGATPAFDVMTEIGFWTQEDWRSFLDLCLQPEVGEVLAEDEARIFDRSSLHVVLAEEYRSADAPG